MNDKFIKSAGHHWWPCSLQKHWANDENLITKLHANGKTETAKCRYENGKMKRTNFCKIQNGHVVFKEGFFANTIEPMFDYVDTNFSSFIDEVTDLRSRHECQSIGNVKRSLKPVFSDRTMEKLPEFVASLVVRSPNFRNKCLITANQYRPDGFPAGPKDAIVASNIEQTFQSVQKALEQPGLQFFAYADENEFIFGDGFFSNAYPDSMPQRDLKVLLPLTPQVSFVSAPTIGMYSPGLRLISLNGEWVRYCNDITQAYSKDAVFYSGERPEIIEGFELRQHLMLKYHQHELVEYLASVFGQRFSRGF